MDSDAGCVFGMTLEERLALLCGRAKDVPVTSTYAAAGNRSERTVYDACAYCGRDDYAADDKHGCIGCGAPRRRVPASAGVIRPGQMYSTGRVGPGYFYG